MKIPVFICVLLLSGCLNASQKNEKLARSVCEFDFTFTGECDYRQINIKFNTSNIAADEKLIKSLLVTVNSKKIELDVLADTVLFSSDVGHVSFEDINFDGLPDIAITTSFGTANLYLDYWVYVKKENTFKRVGNFSRFVVDENTKILRNTVKINAAEYQNNVYRWRHGELVKE